MFQLICDRILFLPTVHRTISTCCLSAMLVACGSDDDFGAATPQRTGVFLDSAAVEGLGFSTATMTGRTNASGEFDFNAGESITFSLGEFDLPTVQAAAIVSTVDIFGTSDVADPRVADLSRLLQTLDTDSIASNGITLPLSLESITSTTSLDFGAANFDAQAGLVLLEINDFQVPLVAEETATAELTESLIGNEIISEGCTSDHPLVGRSAELSTFAHGVSGTITVLNDCILEVTNFNYDGGGPAVYFFAGTDQNYRSGAFPIGPRLNGQQWVNDTVRLPIPEGRSLDEFNSLSVWCFDFNANFGDTVL